MFQIMDYVGAVVLPKAAAQLIGTCPGTNSSLTGQNGYFRPLCPITQDATLGQLVDSVISIILYLAGALAVIYLLYSGILYITAGGDDTKATKARTGIVNAVIGVIIIVLAFVIEKSAARLFT